MKIYMHDANNSEKKERNTFDHLMKYYKTVAAIYTNIEFDK